MNTMKWLLRREYWENKGMFFWAPVIAAGLILLTVATASFKASSAMANRMQANVNGQNITLQINGIPAEAVDTVSNVLAATYMVTAAPLLVLMIFALFFYCLGALYDDRRDRSILFWKSLPISDTETVGSKVVAALVLVPLLYIGISVALSLVSLMIGAATMAGHGMNVYPALFGSSALYKSPLMIVGLLPVYALWALPTVGWLLMVSSWARSKVFLWAVGVPLMVLAVLAMIEGAFGIDTNLEWIGENVVLRALGGLVPGIWLGFDNIDADALVTTVKDVPDFTGVFAASWGTLAGTDVWIGAAAGIAMIAVAVRMRRWRDEG